MENRFSDFYFSSYGRLYLQFTSMSAKFPCVSQTEKKNRSKMNKFYWKDAHRPETDFFVLEFFFVRLLVFEIWSILYMVEFHTSTYKKNRPLSQKLKVAQKKIQTTNLFSEQTASFLKI